MSFLQAYLFANKMFKVSQIRAELGLLHRMCELGHLHLLKTITCFQGVVNWSQLHNDQTPLMTALLHSQTHVVKHIMQVCPHF